MSEINTTKVLELLGLTSESKMERLRSLEQFPVCPETSANEMLNADLRKAPARAANESATSSTPAKKRSSQQAPATPQKKTLPRKAASSAQESIVSKQLKKGSAGCKTSVKECKTSVVETFKRKRCAKECGTPAGEMMVDTTKDSTFPEEFDFDEKAFGDLYGIDPTTISATYVEADAQSQIDEHVDVSFTYEGSTVVLSIYSDNRVVETVDAEEVEAQFSAEFVTEKNDDGSEQTVLHIELIDEEDDEGDEDIPTEEEDVPVESAVSEAVQKNISAKAEAQKAKFIEAWKKKYAKYTKNLVIGTYDNTGDFGLDKDEFDEQYEFTKENGRKGNMAYMITYGDEGAYVVFIFNDGSMAHCGLGQDNDNATLDQCVELLAQDIPADEHAADESAATEGVDRDELMDWYESEEADDAIAQVGEKLFAYADAHGLGEDSFMVDAESIEGRIGFSVPDKPIEQTTVDYCEFLGILMTKGVKAAYNFVIKSVGKAIGTGAAGEDIEDDVAPDSNNDELDPVELEMIYKSIIRKLTAVPDDSRAEDELVEELEKSGLTQEEKDIVYSIKNEAVDGAIMSEGDAEHTNEDGDTVTDEFIEEAGLDLDPFYSKDHKMKVAKGFDAGAMAGYKATDKTGATEDARKKFTKKSGACSKSSANESLAAKVIRNSK